MKLSFQWCWTLQQRKVLNTKYRSRMEISLSFHSEEMEQRLRRKHSVNTNTRNAKIVDSLNIVTLTLQDHFISCCCDSVERTPDCYEFHFVRLHVLLFITLAAISRLHCRMLLVLDTFAYQSDSPYTVGVTSLKKSSESRERVALVPEFSFCKSPWLNGYLQ